MFSKKKANATVSALDGLQGRYIRRTSPPTIPTCLSTTNQYVTARKSTDGVRRNVNANPPPPIAASISTASANSVDFENNNCAVQRPHSSSIISSFSTCSAPLPVEQQMSFLDDEEDFSPTTMANLSSQSFRTADNRERAIQRRILTASHSIGNVQSLAGPSESYMPYHSPQQRFISLQSLPQNYYGSDLIYDANTDTKRPLPPDWEVEYTKEGHIYYVDHRNHRTHWFHPYETEDLPPGWRKIFDNERGGVYYHNTMTNANAFQNPTVAVTRTESMLVSSRCPDDKVDNLNIIQNDEVPEWLLLYSKADDSLDHLLRWELFNADQLNEYSLMIHKLFKQQMYDTVYK
ncbi:hypothetical protein WR25_09262 [Diploscapter pachys]|uniref:WW domain-containing protein n=1 Tax=Diploscapter pachys TaxID=2018661 RepID=A0A2A2KVP3_9BILA|nr:hypothetical protein WR25_09262 [Diploscapter pachys]